MRMTIACPSCGANLTDADVNVATDVGACKSCGNVFKLSEAVGSAPAVPFDSLSAPPGTWFIRTADGFDMGATTRSYQALFLVPFTCIWSGFSIGGIYGTQLISGKLVLSQSLFGIPFLLGSLLLWWGVLMSIFGRNTLTASGDNATIFSGVGPIGWRKRFAWSGVRSVVEETYRTGRRGGSQTSLFLQGETKVKFAAGISDARRYYLLQALRSMIAH
jgi:hypothetical protein